MKGIEKIWITGDDFGFNSFNKYFYQHSDEDQYAKSAFEVSGFHNDRLQSYDTNTISRIRNYLVGAKKDQKILPKFIVLVIDDNIIKYLRHKGGKEVNDSPMQGYEWLLRWLMTQFERLIAVQKEYLADKCRKPHQPVFLWIEPPTHASFRSTDNFHRLEFSKAMQKAVSFHADMYSLQLKKVWDPNDPTLYNSEDKKPTAQGYITYWASVDEAIKFTNTLLLKKEDDKQRKQKHHEFPNTGVRSNSSLHARNPRDHHHISDRFHWHHEDSKHSRKSDFDHHHRR